jgi:anti-sigma regulatory factor (Ser/Thr protein kinase)
MDRGIRQILRNNRTDQVHMTSHRIELEAAITSCSVARRFVVETLVDANDELRLDAELLTSEIVTNALLHATGPVVLEVYANRGTYRIAVSDDSPIPPSCKGYRADDATGRGVEMMDVLAAAWGWYLSGGGKVVWFDLPEPFGVSVQPNPLPVCHDEPFPNGSSISLLNAPVQAMIRTAAHYDALYREFRLILELDPSHLQAIPGRLLALIDSLGTSYSGYGHSVEDAWFTALRDNRESVDLHFRCPPEAAPFVLQYNEMLDEADDYCQQAEFLTVAPTEEALKVRQWAFSQLAGQCVGDTPVPWAG